MCDSFLIYTDYRDHIEPLSYEDRGRLFTAILDYVRADPTEELEGGVRIAFSFIKSQIDRDRDKYESKCEKNRSNGAKGGRPKSSGSSPKTERFSKDHEENPDNRTVFSKTQDTGSVSPETLNEPYPDHDFYSGDGGGVTRTPAHEGDGAGTVPEITPEYLFNRHFGRNPTDSERDTCRALLTQSDPEVVEAAFFNACKEDRKKLSYVLGVMDNYRARGVKDMGGVAEDDLRHDAGKRRRDTS